MLISNNDILRHKTNHKRKLIVLRINGHTGKAVCLVKGKGLKILTGDTLKRSYEKDPDWIPENSMGSML